MTSDIQSAPDTHRGAIPSTAAQAFGDLLAARMSYRAFHPEPVPAQTIREILEAAQLTASWCNSQPWQVAITSGAGTERLRAALYGAATAGEPQKPDVAFPTEYRGVHRDRRRESGYQLYNALGIERGDHEGQLRQMQENFRFFGAPHAAIIHTDEALGPYGAVDCGAYVSNFILAATARGVGSVPQAAVALYSDVLRRELGLGADRVIVCGISFGYPDTDHPANGYRTSRAPLDHVVDWVDS